MANQVVYEILARDSYSKVGKSIAVSTRKMKQEFSKLDRQLMSTDAEFKDLRRSLKRLNSQTNANKVGFGGLKTAIAAMAIAAGAAFVVALQKGMEFEDALADLSAITGATGEKLQFLSDESLRLAKKSSVSASETATAFKLVASAKAELLKNPKALSDVTEQVLLLANASGIDLAKSATVVTESLNQFGAGAEQASRFVNILAAGSKFGASEVDETGRAVVNAGVAATIAGLSFEEFNSTIQILAKSGIKGANAGTALNNIFKRLEAQSDKRLRPSIVGIDKALENLEARNFTVAQSQKLFGDEAFAAATILIRQNKQVREMTDNLTGTDTALKQAAIRTDTLKTRFKDLGIAVDEKIIKVFEQLEKDKVISKLISDTTKWIDSFDEEDIKSIADAINAMVTGIRFLGDALSFVADIISEIGPALRKSFGIEFLEETLLPAVGIDIEGVRASFRGVLSELLTDSSADILRIQRSQEKRAGPESEVRINLNAPPGVINDITTTPARSRFSIGINNMGAQVA